MYERIKRDKLFRRFCCEIVEVCMEATLISREWGGIEDNNKKENI